MLLPLMLLSAAGFTVLTTEFILVGLLPSLARDLGVPVFWALASETAVDLAGQERAGRAISVISFGVICATVIGVPTGTLIADAFGWRAAFVALAIASVLKATLLFVFLPDSRSAQPQMKLRHQFLVLRDPRVGGHVLLSVILFTGMFTAYTYLADMFERLAGFNGSVVGWALMAFGAVGLIGNTLGGRIVDRNPLVASLIFSVPMAIGLVLVVPAVQSLPLFAVTLALWGITQAALFPVSHVRVMKSAPQAPAFAASLNISGANLGIGVGAIVGGRVIDAVGVGGLGYAAAGIVAVSVLLGFVLMSAGKPVEPQAVDAEESEAEPAMDCAS